MYNLMKVGKKKKRKEELKYSVKIHSVLLRQGYVFKVPCYKKYEVNSVVCNNIQNKYVGSYIQRKKQVDHTNFLEWFFLRLYEKLDSIQYKSLWYWLNTHFCKRYYSDETLQSQIDLYYLQSSSNVKELPEGYYKTSITQKELSYTQYCYDYAPYNSDIVYFLKVRQYENDMTVIWLCRERDKKENIMISKGKVVNKDPFVDVGVLYISILDEVNNIS